MNKVLSFSRYFLELFYPNVCLVCSNGLVKGEKLVCIECLNDIPRSRYHLSVDNLVEQRFWGKIPIVRATSYFLFMKGSKLQILLHELKYRNNRFIGEYLGELAAQDICNSDFFEDIDCIVAVPLHHKRELKRGYNQSVAISEGLTSVIGKPILKDAIKRVVESESQTKKSVYERHKNMSGVFSVVSPDSIENKHILLVDDVLTTGSTLEACANEMLKVKGTKITVFTLAVSVL